MSIEPKDYATIALAFASLSTSVMVAIWNVKKTSNDMRASAQERFSGAILGLIQARNKLEELRRSNGDEWNSVIFRAQRGQLGDERQFYISQALSALRVKGVKAYSLEHSALAAGLMDLGRVREALAQFDVAENTALSTPDYLQVKRQAARANFFGRRLVEARSLFQIVANGYVRLSEMEAFTSQVMLEGACETYRRWAELELQAGGSLEEAERTIYKMNELRLTLVGSARTVADGNMEELERLLSKRSHEAISRGVAKGEDSVT